MKNKLKMFLSLGVIVISMASCAQQALAPIGELDLESAVQPLPKTAIYEDEGYFVWGGSPIYGDDGKYHLYYSRWEHKYSFEGYATHSEIAHAVSDKPYGPYKFSDVSLPHSRGAQYWDGSSTHNPNIHKFGDKYYLYYMGTDGKGDRAYGKGLNWEYRNTSQTGVAVSDSPYGPWERFDNPIIAASDDPKAADALTANNVTVTQTPEGKYLLMYKCVGKKKPLPFGGPVAILTATSDSPIGPFKKLHKKIFHVEGAIHATEDPYMWYQDNCYYTIIKDSYGELQKTVLGKKGHYGMTLFYSLDGLDWKPTKNLLILRQSVLSETGEKIQFSNLEKPQLLFKDGKPIGLFCAANYKYGEHSFNVHIPLKFEE